jgi:homoaconitase/3-isopropylmalate dehydratase large subunit
MRIAVYGRRGPAVGAKDVILAIIATIGTGGGVGHAIEYAGAAIRAMSVTERLTACNMSIEVGARYCMVAPDEGDVRLAARPSVHADRPSSRRTVMSLGEPVTR